jgi:hypothetical protein
MEIDVGAGNTSVVSDWREPTYNLYEMFKAALGRPIKDLEGMTGAEAEPILVGAVTAMIADPPKFKALNPPNGWGDYEGGKSTLEWMLEASRFAPLARWKIS